MQRREFLTFAAASGLLSGTAGAAPVAGTSLSAALFGWSLASWGFSASAHWLFAAAIVASLPMLLLKNDY